MCSKDNERFPKYLRELFEKPLDYSPTDRKASPHPYGWEININNPITVLRKSLNSNQPKIPTINSVAFSNFLSSTYSKFSRTRSLSTLPAKPKTIQGKTVKYYNDHLLV
jgi:hypothetical protein